MLYLLYGCLPNNITMFPHRRLRICVCLYECATAEYIYLSTRFEHKFWWNYVFLSFIISVDRFSKINFIHTCTRLYVNVLLCVIIWVLRARERKIYTCIAYLQLNLNEWWDLLSIIQLENLITKIYIRMHIAHVFIVFACRFHFFGYKCVRGLKIQIENEVESVTASCVILR